MKSLVLLIAGLLIGVFLTYFASLIGILPLFVLFIFASTTILFSIFAFYAQFSDDEGNDILFIG